ncbi:MAG: YihY/virulence factor BrkB family protein [Balneolaceae bacterium]|nr:YihY/virulence factor BrkB family protein [Balneolaceae bacterium]MCH8548900.1 YihY/virulence factor BrkB family protein [Balneolaceae bacterium]
MIKTVLQDTWDLIRLTFKKAIDDDIITQGAAIAFYTIFSIAPLFILIVSLGGLFLSEELITAQVQEQLGDYLDDDMIATLNEFLAARTESAGGTLTTIIALGTVIFGATTVISQLKTTLNRIWNVSDIKINSVFHFLINRALSFGMIIIFSLLLISSLVAEAAIAVVAGFFVDLVPEIEVEVYRFASRFGTMIFAVLFFTLIFKILPDVHARWKDVLIGALVTTALFLLGKFLIGYFFSATGIEATYRAAGSLVVFIIWVYYNIQTILLGAVFTQVYTEKFGGRILPYKFVSLKNFALGTPEVDNVKKEEK